MDMNLNKENINYVKMIYSASFTHEETMELIVPDAQPDILEILDTDAVVLLRSKEADTGRVVISGVINATVLYAPEDSGDIKKLELSMPFSACLLYTSSGWLCQCSAEENCRKCRAASGNSAKGF